MKALELVVVFIVLPLLFFFNFIPGPKAISLLLVFVATLIYLLSTKSFNRKELGFNGFKGWQKVLLRSVVAVVLIVILTLIFLPQNLFYLPKNNPKLWLLIMVFYPIWSAFTQEFIYRSFFFFRYKTLFPNQKILAVVNGLLFGFLHIIFKNWIAVVGATAVGLIWAFSYLKHRSLLVVTLEHSIVGNLLYTVGLGYYFYVPDFS